MQLIKIMQCKCPNCKKGEIFESSGNILLLRMPRMHVSCPNCGFRFEKETGFFFGAMYVSYGLAAGIMIAAIALLWGILDLNPLWVFIVIAVLIVFTSTYNFMLSRTIWIYFFYENRDR
ncbi:DUF983 domain-containing protein [Flavobacterium beibuense]|uniref:DUF983 domain-containing protein n=1 Tax=Flavobacterium beibuense TaxID=657326 RepID=UPI00101DBA80|nr:DUF983 domain-containing protein [Flavobacterium beibuense]